MREGILGTVEAQVDRHDATESIGTTNSGYISGNVTECCSECQARMGLHVSARAAAGTFAYGEGDARPRREGTQKRKVRQGDELPSRREEVSDLIV